MHDPTNDKGRLRGAAQASGHRNQKSQSNPTATSLQAPEWVELGGVFFRTRSTDAAFERGLAGLPLQVFDDRAEREIITAFRAGLDARAETKVRRRHVVDGLRRRRQAGAA